MAELVADLNRLAGTSGLEAAGAANAWAATSGLELVAALNAKNGTSGLGMNAVVRALATTYGGNPALDWNQALATATGSTAPTLSNVQAWSKSDELALANGAAVTSFTDRSGNSRPFVSAGNPPSYVTNELNGKDIVRFDGTNDLLRQAAFGTIAQPWSIFLVMRLRNNAGIYYLPARDGTFLTMFSLGAGDGWRLHAGSGMNSSIANDTSWHIFHLIGNGASSRIRVGGGAGVLGDAGSVAFSALDMGGNLGASSYSQIDVAEVIVQNVVPSTATTNEIGNYLATEYALTWTTV